MQTQKKYKDNIPKLDYGIREKAPGLLSSCKYSMIYLTKLFKIFELCTKLFESQIKLSVANDYPMTMENEHFKIILAPRISNE